MCSRCDDRRPQPLSHGSVGVNSPLAPRLVRGQGKQAASQSHSFYVCVCVCVVAAHSVLFDSTGLIRHPAPWQRQDLNSSVKSLSTQTHARSPQRRRERIRLGSSQRGDYRCLATRPPPQRRALTTTSETVGFPACFLFIYLFICIHYCCRVSTEKGGKKNRKQGRNSKEWSGRA